MVDAITGFGLSILSGHIANITTTPIVDGVQRLTQKLNSAHSLGILPENHHIERGTTRACLMATQICIQQLIDTNREDFLDDIENAVLIDGVVHKRLGYYRDPHRHIAARSTLQKKLHELISALEPQDVYKSKHRNTEQFDSALKDAKLLISVPSLEGFGSDIISAINTRSEKLSKSPTIKEVRQNLLPNLADGVVKQVLDFGKWPENRHKEISKGIYANFFGEDEQWTKNFALCYADEIKRDTNLFRMAVFLRLERADDSLETIKFKPLFYSKDSFQLNLILKHCEMMLISFF